MAEMSIDPIRELVEEVRASEAQIRKGGGDKAIERQHAKGRLTARERVELLVDDMSAFTELGLWAAHGMYAEHGGAPGAGVVTGVGPVEDRLCMIIANDATVKAGAFFPMTCKKIIRAQHVARMARMPLLYLVDSAGVFLPLQEDVFPDTDDFGRIFYLNAVLSAEGIPQLASIMGFCVAGGGYLPVLCDNLIMTEGSGLYLAGPALVKAAIGQEVSDEELGGASMHAEISGTIDFKEPDDRHAIARLRSLVGAIRTPTPRALGAGTSGASDADRVYEVFSDKPGSQYEMHELIGCIVDEREGGGPHFDEYKNDYGRSMVCGYAHIGGHACGIVANERRMTERKMPGGKAGPSRSINMPAVIYDDAADKAARFIMDCNQKHIPILFLHDTNGFMVGRDSEQAGIIRAGAKLVNAVSNSVVPKISVILGGSYGAGHYAMCGRAFEPFVTLAWPNAKYAVMGANQATGTLAMIEERARQRRGEEIDEATHKEILAGVHASYTEQADVRHGAARGWVDRIIEPHRTRDEVIAALDMTTNWDRSRPFKTGVLQT